MVLDFECLRWDCMVQGFEQFVWGLGFRQEVFVYCIENQSVCVEVVKDVVIICVCRQVGGLQGVMFWICGGIEVLGNWICRFGVCLQRIIFRGVLCLLILDQMFVDLVYYDVDLF